MFCFQMICISTKAILLLFALLFLILNRSTEYTTRLDVYTKHSDDDNVYLYLPKAVRILIAVCSVDSNQGRKQRYGLLPIGRDKPCDLTDELPLGMHLLLEVLRLVLLKLLLVHMA